MKTLATQQEILLMKASTFFQNQWIEKDADSNKRMSTPDQLENACWNGMLDEMFPEILIKSEDGKKLFVWYVHQCESFLQVELSEAPEKIEQGSSINPYVFLPAVFYN